MMGYSRYALVRMVPDNGAEEVLDLMQAFTDARGPTTIEEQHRLVAVTTRENINRELSPRHYGFRSVTRLRFDICTMEDQQWLARMVNRAIRDDWTTYLSVDAGTNEQEVELTAYDGPDVLQKSYIGARYSMTLTAVELLDEIPLISDDPPSPIALPSYVPAVSSLPAASILYYRRVLIDESTTPHSAVICLDDGAGGYQWRAWA